MRASRSLYLYYDKLTGRRQSKMNRSMRSVLLDLKTVDIARYGLFCELPCAEAVEIAGLAGWDFVVIDGEHAQLSPPMLPQFVRAATVAGIAAIVRVPSNEPAHIQHALDCGASGVQVPQIGSVEDARRAVRAARFHPLGSRGLNVFVRAADFSLDREFIARANEETTLVLQVESAEGVAAVEEIAAIPGVDAVFIGPYDLSQSLGIPGQVSDELVFEAGRRIARAVAGAGVALGVFTNSEADARRWLDVGVRYLCYSVDVVLLVNAMKTAREQFR